MTEQKHPELTGRDLDAAVARAMGREVEVGTLDDYVFKSADDFGPWIRTVSPYSTDMGACWREVVPELHRVGLDVDFATTALGHYHVIVMECAHIRYEEHCATADVPAALCRALLKVKEKGEGA